MAQLRVLSLNVGGIKDDQRRRDIFHWLLASTNADVFLLQETHLYPSNLTHKWTMEWANYAIATSSLHQRCSWWSPSDTAYSGGTAILLRPSRRNRLRVTSVSISAAHRGAHTSITCSFSNSRLSLHSIYAPAAPVSRLAFYAALSSSERDGQGTVSVYGGDYNCVNVVARDTIYMPHYSNQGAEQLAAACVDRSLVDLWLETATEEQLHSGGFTRRSPTSTAASRIDRIYASAASVQSFSDIHVVPQPDLTDHDGVEVTFTSDGPRPPRAQWWSLNPAHLKDEVLVSSLADGWRMLRAQSPELSTVEAWHLYKQQIQRMSVSHAVAKAQARRARREGLQSRLSAPDLSVEARARLRGQLTALNSLSQRDRATTTSMHYQAEDDRPTQAFFRKQGHHHVRHTKISRLTLPSGESVSSPSQLRAELVRFWGSVFGGDGDEVVTPEMTPPSWLPHFSWRSWSRH